MISLKCIEGSENYSSTLSIYKFDSIFIKLVLIIIMKIIDTKTLAY